jgi:hypothetical protein
MREISWGLVKFSLRRYDYPSLKKQNAPSERAVLMGSGGSMLDASYGKNSLNQYQY